MKFFLLLILFAVGLSASYDFEDRLATALTKLLAAEAEAKLKFPLAGHFPTEKMISISAAAVAGGLDVVEKVQNILNELPMIKFLTEQTETVNKIIEDMRKEAKAMQKALGKKYIAFQNKLVTHIEKTEQVGTRLIKLATTAWLRCGVNAQDILDYGYTKRAQEAFSKFLEEAIAEAVDIISKLEEIKIGVHQLKQEAKSNQRIIKQYFEGERALLESRKKANKKLWWICVIPIACPFAATSIEGMKKNINEQIKYMDNLGKDLLSNFGEAESQADRVYVIMQKWIPQSRALQTALEHTASMNDNVIAVLEENYINDHPEEAGIRNAYLIRLFDAMKGLQTAAEGVEGFPMDQMDSLGGIRVPDYPTQHDVCACLSIDNIADWSQSRTCRNGASAAMQEIDDFPWCRFSRQSCKEDIKNYLPNMCRATRDAENEAFVAKEVEWIPLH